MKPDKLTQQLHDKLADYQTPAPDGLWDDIEAALPSEGAAAQGDLQSPVPAQGSRHARFVSLRRWAAAAAVAAIIAGGGLVLYNTGSNYAAMEQEYAENMMEEQPDDGSFATEQSDDGSFATEQPDDGSFATERQGGLKGQQAHSPGQRPGYYGGSSLALKGQKHQNGSNAFALTGRLPHDPLTQGAALGYEQVALSGRRTQDTRDVKSTTPTETASENDAATDMASENVIATETASKNVTATDIASENVTATDMASKNVTATETASENITETASENVTATEAASKNITETASENATATETAPRVIPSAGSKHLPQHQNNSVKRKWSSRPSLNLYAMNSLGAKDNSNAVFMADALAKYYTNTFNDANLPAARRQAPIYLSGYEERQHHYQPVAFGLTFDYPLSARLSLSSGVVYTRLRSDFTQIIRSQHISQEQTLHYVGVPLGLSYRLCQLGAFRAYATAGVQADWNVAARQNTEGVERHMDRDRVQWSASASLGLQYSLPFGGTGLALYAEPGISHYFDNGSTVQNFFKDKPTSMKLQVGLRLTLRP